jgi:hypothetical protein
MTSQPSDYISIVLGAGIVIGIAARYIAVPSDSERNDRLMLIAVFTLLGGWASTAIANVMGNIPLPKYDLFVYAFDRHLGSPSFVVGTVCGLHPVLFSLLNWAYTALPIMVTLVLLSYAWAGYSLNEPVTAFLFNVLLAPFLYLLIPVAGPRYAFASFPREPALISLHLMPLHAPPNGIPSVHMSTAILIVRFAWRWKIGRWFAVLYLVATIISTMAVGEHYAIDLLAGIPYALGVLALAKMPKAQLTHRTPDRQATPEPLS